MESDSVEKDFIKIDVWNMERGKDALDIMLPTNCSCCNEIFVFDSL